MERKRWRGGVRVLPLPPLSWPVSFLTKQPGWLWSSESSQSLLPPGPENLVLYEFPVCLVEDLAVLLPSGTLRGTKEEGWAKEKSTRQKDRGEVGGEKAKGETLNTPELGLIYFINRDYKFNLQTRGQNFSLTRGPWRTSGLGDHSYY